MVALLNIVAQIGAKWLESSIEIVDPKWGKKYWQKYWQKYWKSIDKIIDKSIDNVADNIVLLKTTNLIFY